MYVYVYIQEVKKVIPHDTLKQQKNKFWEKQL